MRYAIACACLLILASVPAQATVYCVDATGGSDGNSGISALGDCTDAAPFRSLWKINGLNLSAGDKVLFKRGERWFMHSSCWGECRVTVGNVPTGVPCYDTPQDCQSIDPGWACQQSGNSCSDGWGGVLDVPSSGTSFDISAPSETTLVNFGAYGTGEDPILSGGLLDTAEGWTWSQVCSPVRDFYGQCSVGGGACAYDSDCGAGVCAKITCTNDATCTSFHASSVCSVTSPRQCTPVYAYQAADLCTSTTQCQAFNSASTCTNIYRAVSGVCDTESGSPFGFTCSVDGDCPSVCGAGKDQPCSCIPNSKPWVGCEGEIKNTFSRHGSFYDAGTYERWPRIDVKRCEIGTPEQGKICADSANCNAGDCEPQVGETLEALTAGDWACSDNQLFAWDRAGASTPTPPNSNNGVWKSFTSKAVVRLNDKKFLGFRDLILEMGATRGLYQLSSGVSSGSPNYTPQGSTWAEGVWLKDVTTRYNGTGVSLVGPCGQDGVSGAGLYNVKWLIEGLDTYNNEEAGANITGRIPVEGDCVNYFFSTGIEIRHSKFHHNGLTTLSAGAGIANDGIKVFWTGGDEDTNGFLFRYNDVYENDGKGINFDGTVGTSNNAAGKGVAHPLDVYSASGGAVPGDWGNWYGRIWRNRAWGNNKAGIMYEYNATRGLIGYNFVARTCFDEGANGNCDIHIAHRSHWRNAFFFNVVQQSSCQRGLCMRHDTATATDDYVNTPLIAHNTVVQTDDNPNSSPKHVMFHNMMGALSANNLFDNAQATYIYEMKKRDAANANYAAPTYNCDGTAGDEFCIDGDLWTPTGKRLEVGNSANVCCLTGSEGGGCTIGTCTVTPEVSCSATSTCRNWSLANLRDYTASGDNIGDTSTVTFAGDVCEGGTNAGGSCTADGQCPGGICKSDTRKLCTQGPNDGQSCSNDSNCPGGRCTLSGTTDAFDFMPTDQSQLDAATTIGLEAISSDWPWSYNIYLHPDCHSNDACTGPGKAFPDWDRPCCTGYMEGNCAQDYQPFACCEDIAQTTPAHCDFAGQSINVNSPPVGAFAVASICEITSCTEANFEAAIDDMNAGVCDKITFNCDAGTPGITETVTPLLITSNVTDPARRAERIITRGEIDGGAGCGVCSDAPWVLCDGADIGGASTDCGGGTCLVPVNTGNPVSCVQFTYNPESCPTDPMVADCLIDGGPARDDSWILRVSDDNVTLNNITMTKGCKGIVVSDDAASTTMNNIHLSRFCDDFVATWQADPPEGMHNGTLSNSFFTVGPNKGIQVNESTSFAANQPTSFTLTIDNVRVEDVNSPLVITKGNRTSIKNSTFTNGANTDHNCGTGVLIGENDPGNVVTYWDNNTVEYCKHGVWIKRIAEAVIRNSTLRYNGVTNLMADDSAKVLVENTIITDNCPPGGLYSCTSGAVAGNTVSAGVYSENDAQVNLGQLLFETAGLTIDGQNQFSEGKNQIHDNPAQNLGPGTNLGNVWNASTFGQCAGGSLCAINNWWGSTDDPCLSDPCLDETGDMNIGPVQWGPKCEAQDCGVSETQGACCLPTGCQVVADEGACSTAGGYWGGTGTDCTGGGPCRACCQDDGSCSMYVDGSEASQCTAFGGTPDPTGTNSCADQGSGAPRCSGACCNDSTGCEEGQTVNDCAALPNGSFQGYEVDCITAACPLVDVGACCASDLPTNTCAETTQAACSGFAWFNARQCPPDGLDSCNEGACCTAGLCSIDTEYDCGFKTGTFGGVGTTCGDVDCGTLPTFSGIILEGAKSE